VALVALCVEDGFDITQEIDLRFNSEWQFFLGSLKRWGYWAGKQQGIQWPSCQDDRTPVTDEETQAADHGVAAPLTPNPSPALGREEPSCLTNFNSFTALSEGVYP